MSNLKEIRSRISSVNNTKKITSAMKMVSAAKFKKAQDNLSHYKPFFEENRTIIESILKSTKVTNEYCADRKLKKKIGIVLITSNSSMCGAFNQNVIRTTLNETVQLDYKYPRSTIEFLCIGKRGYDFFNKKGFATISLNNHILDKPDLETTRETFNIIADKFLKGDFDVIYLIYNAFKNAAVQIQKVEKFLPFEVIPEEGYKSTIDIVEPNHDLFIKKTLPNFLLYKLHFAIANSSAAEHGARMTAMHQATDNATDLIRELILQYNKARQASITKEILEIVSGANALRG